MKNALVERIREGAVVDLASPASDWITGEHLLVAGGRTHRTSHYETRPNDE